MSGNDIENADAFVLHIFYRQQKGIRAGLYVYLVRRENGLTGVNATVNLRPKSPQTANSKPVIPRTAALGNPTWYPQVDILHRFGGMQMNK